MLNTNSQSRDQNIDILKGIAMCLVIWGHALQFSSLGRLDFFALPVFRFIYSFHMPLFASVSGYLLGLSLYRRTFQENVLHKTATIFWPIMTGNLLWVLMVGIPTKALKDGHSLVLYVLNDIWRGHWLTFFWFLWAVLACSIATCVIFQKIKHPVAKVLTVFVSFIFLAQFPCGNLIFNIFPFFIVGTLFACEKQRLYSMRFTHSVWLEILFIVSFILLLPFFKGDCFIYRPIYLAKISFSQNMYIYAIRLSCGFLGTISVVVLLKRLSYINAMIHLRFLRVAVEWIKKRVVFIGINSLKFYILQAYIFDGGWLEILLRNTGIALQFSWIYKYKYVYQFSFTLLIAALVIVVLYIIIFLMAKRNIAQYLWKP